MFQYARSIYESEVCLVIMPITDRTSWQIPREGALRSFESESLFLPTPAPELVIRKRIEFLEEKLAAEQAESGSGYFVGRGIRLSVENLVAFTATLQTIFVNTGEVATWVGHLANNDVRRCLEISKTLITSPHLNVGELVTTYVAGSSLFVPRHKLKRALLRGMYDIYSQDGTVVPFVFNIFALSDDLDGSPLMGIRLLSLLRDVQADAKNDPFVTVDQITDYFRSMVVDASVTTSWLSAMLECGLCLSYDPTITDISQVQKVELSPSGEQHLVWGIFDRDYVQTMLEVTPISDPATYERLNALNNRPRRDVWQELNDQFVSYLIDEDSNYCKVPVHESYDTQRKVSSLIGNLLIGVFDVPAGTSTVVTTDI